MGRTGAGSVLAARTGSTRGAVDRPGDERLLIYNADALIEPGRPQPQNGRSKTSRSSKGGSMVGEALEMAEVGVRLRAARVAGGHSLGDIARQTGLSSSFLSLVENGKSDISLGRLTRLIDVLGLGLADLTGPTAPADSLERFEVLRRDARRALRSEAGVLTEFLPRSPKLGIDRFIMTFSPGGTIDVDEYKLVLPAESFYLMLKGELCLQLADAEPLRLRSGDSIALLHEDFRRSWNDRRYDAVVLVEAQLHR